ncbi:MAG: hypothetical protein GXY48_14700 [Methanomicrobiales archaeon]|nr:hypothetical protein [Methanomicrobiales archaeon]
MTKALTVLETLKSIKPQLASQYHIRRFGLFGSVIRGEQSPEIDIDILVEFDTTPSIFGFLELEEKLEEYYRLQLTWWILKGLNLFSVQKSSRKLSMSEKRDLPNFLTDRLNAADKIIRYNQEKESS